MAKTSVRFFEDIPVPAVWEERTSRWRFCTADIAEALTKSKRPRTYRNAIKRRDPQLSAICRQRKLTAKGGKEICCTPFRCCLPLEYGRKGSDR